MPGALCDDATGHKGYPLLLGVQSHRDRHLLRSFLPEQPLPLTQPIYSVSPQKSIGVKYSNTVKGKTTNSIHEPRSEQSNFLFTLTSHPVFTFRKCQRHTEFNSPGLISPVQFLLGNHHHELNKYLCMCACVCYGFEGSEIFFFYLW